MDSTPDTPLAMRPERYAQRTDLSRAQIYKFLAQGMPSLKLGRSRRILVADADAWLITHLAEQDAEVSS